MKIKSKIIKIPKNNLNVLIVTGLIFGLLLFVYKSLFKRESIQLTIPKNTISNGSYIGPKAWYGNKQSLPIYDPPHDPPPLIME